MGPLSLQEFAIALTLLIISVSAFTAAMLTLPLVRRDQRERVKCVGLMGASLVFAIMFAGDVLWMIDVCVAFDRSQKAMPQYIAPVPAPSPPGVQTSTLSPAPRSTPIPGSLPRGSRQGSQAARKALEILKKLALKRP
jgi:hypothetical protein